MQARTSSDTGVPQKPRTLRVAPHNFVEIKISIFSNPLILVWFPAKP